MNPGSGRQIYVSTSCLRQTQDYFTHVDQYIRSGFSNIELGFANNFQESDLERIREQPGNFLVHNYFPPPDEPFVFNLASRNEAITGKSINLAKRAIQLCSELGAPFYSFHAGFITDPVGFDGTGYVFPEPGSPDERLAAEVRFVQNLVNLLDYSAKYHVRLLVENNVCEQRNKGKLLFQLPGDVDGLFARVPNPNLGMLLDTGHLNVTARTYGFDRSDFVQRALPRVTAFHVHDNDGVRDLHQPIDANSWIIEVLNTPHAKSIPVILEAKYADIAAIKNQLAVLDPSVQSS